MGATTQQKIANMLGLIDRGVIAPTELVARAVARLRPAMSLI
jgi:hypothetical protein